MISIVSIVVGAGAFFSAILLTESYPHFSGTIGTSAAVVIVSAILTAIYGAVGDHSGKLKRNTEHLRRDEVRIEERIHAFKIRLERIGDVRGNLKNSTRDQTKDSVGNILDNSENLIRQYQMRYRVELLKVELIRWQNKIEAIAYGSDNITYQQVSVRIRELTPIIEEGRGHLERLKEDEAAETREGEDTIANLTASLQNTEDLYDALIAQQAKLAILGISPIESKERKIGEVDKNLSDISSRAAASRFSSSLTELEAEFDRIQAEEELTKEI